MLDIFVALPDLLRHINMNVVKFFCRVYFTEGNWERCLMELVDSITLLNYTSHIIQIVLLYLCYKQTEEHGSILGTAIFRLGLFSLVSGIVAFSHAEINTLLKYHMLMGITTFLANHLYTRWAIKNKERLRIEVLAICSVVWLSLIIFPFNELVYKLVMVLTAVMIFNTGVVLFRCKHVNPFLVKAVFKFWIILTIGTLILYSLALLFDPFYESLQFLRPRVYTFSFPFRLFFDFWVNLMFSIIAYTTLFGMPHPGRTPTATFAAKNGSITPRESEVLALLFEGKSNGEIAAELDIAIPTTKTHVRNIYRKIGVSTRHELMCLAVQR